MSASEDPDLALDELEALQHTICAKCFREVPLADTVKMVGERSRHEFRWCLSCAGIHDQCRQPWSDHDNRNPRNVLPFGCPGEAVAA